MYALQAAWCSRVPGPHTGLPFAIFRSKRCFRWRCVWQPLPCATFRLLPCGLSAGAERQVCPWHPSGRPRPPAGTRSRLPLRDPSAGVGGRGCTSRRPGRRRRLADTRTSSVVSAAVSTCRKSAARILAAWACERLARIRSRAAWVTPAGRREDAAFRTAYHAVRKATLPLRAWFPQTRTRNTCPFSSPT